MVSTTATSTTMTTVKKNKMASSDATTVTTTQVRSPLNYKKRLEGIEATPELKELWKQALKVAIHTTMPQDEEDKENSSSSSSSSRNLVQQVSRHFTFTEAKKVLLDTGLTGDQEISKQKCVPIPVIRAMEALLHHKGDESSSAQKLETALQSSKLVFTQPPKLTKQQAEERKRFVERMERLKLKDEERNYSKLTHNLQTRAAKAADDDVTTKSMTYAASIGLNMIVAPLSFGCFMYFFAGGLFDFLGWKNLEATAVVDIKRVIVGVISGVAMLFIEMILFVIRTHEMDRAMRQKKAKQTRKLGRSGPGAFGHYTSKTAREFKED